VLFGKIVDVLSGKPQTGPLASNSAWPLWRPGWRSAVHHLLQRRGGAARRQLAHRQRQAVLTDYFEHIMQLPLTFHTGTHSGG
jgi:ATP-binding cassette subfamily B protein